uniref:Plasminogen activator inhibitor 1 RNA-binding protein-like n=1 Tax=Rhizophora mucronata TaxID=61149 RepID=A0A2P2L2Q9_RHIMU
MGKATMALVAVAEAGAVDQEVDLEEAMHVMQQPPQLKIQGSSPPWVANEAVCAIVVTSVFPSTGILCDLIMTFGSKLYQKALNFHKTMF